MQTTTGNESQRDWRPLSAVLLAALIVRLALLAAEVVPLGGDEAIVALMARHIRQGGRPIFFYGQAYFGSLGAWLASGVYALLGESLFSFRVAQTLIYLGTLLTTYWLARRIYPSRWIAAAGVLFLAVPTALVAVYTSTSPGAYNEMLFLGNLILLFALKLGTESGQWLDWALLGFFSGVGVWTFPLIAVYLIPAWIFVVFRHVRPMRQLSTLAWGAVVACVGFLIGAAPWLWYSLTHGWATLRDTSAPGVIASPNAGPLGAVSQAVPSLILFGPTVLTGLRPPWSVELLALPLAPLAAALYLALTVFLARRWRAPNDAARAGRSLLLGLCAFALLVVLAGARTLDPTGRHLLPLAIPLALFMAEFLYAVRRRRRWLGNGLALGLIAFQGLGLAQTAATYPPGLTAQLNPAMQIDQRGLPALMDFLRAHGETRGYTNYWVAYPMAFLSHEQIIFAARLPYQGALCFPATDDNYPAYAEQVRAAPRAALITTRWPALDAKLRSELNAQGVTFAEQRFGDFNLFYRLSRRVTPDELGLPLCR